MNDALWRVFAYYTNPSFGRGFPYQRQDGEVFYVKAPSLDEAREKAERVLMLTGPYGEGATAPPYWLRLEDGLDNKMACDALNYIKANLDEKENRR